MDLKPGKDVFRRTAVVSGDLAREFSVVVVLEYMESEARLIQVIDTLNPPRTGLALSQDRQQERRQDADDGNDHQ